MHCSGVGMELVGLERLGVETKEEARGQIWAGVKNQEVLIPLATVAVGMRRAKAQARVLQNPNI